MRNDRPIGVFDSGVGGISTLKTLCSLLPHENFIFYGDSKNAPYGVKTPEEVFGCSEKIIKYFLSKNVKAVVIACNTATSVAKEKLLKTFPDIPIVGIEPALKEAIDKNGKNILVMGTSLTIQLPKFQKMLHQYEKNHTIYALPCPRLADYVEQGLKNPEGLDTLLKDLLIPFKSKGIDSVVLGCTHYPFIQKEINAFFSDTITFYTGYEGVGTQLVKVLERKNILSKKTDAGYIEWKSSEIDKLDFYKQLYSQL